jgi:hypothetical protein
LVYLRKNKLRLKKAVVELVDAVVDANAEEVT